MKKTAYILAALLTFGFAANAMAQDAAVADPGHPRVNEVQQRIDNQENRVDQGVSDGQINAGQAKRDDAKLGREQNSLNQDQAKDGGHITKSEKHNLNKRLNKGSKKIHHQRVKAAATPAQ